MPSPRKGSWWPDGGAGRMLHNPNGTARHHVRLRSIRLYGHIVKGCSSPFQSQTAVVMFIYLSLWY